MNEEIKFPNFSKRKRQFKETEEGVFELGEEIQRLMDKKLQEGKQEGVREAIVSCIKNVMATFNVPVEKAMDALDIPPSQRGTYTELIGRA